MLNTRFLRSKYFFGHTVIMAALVLATSHSAHAIGKAAYSKLETMRAELSTQHSDQIVNEKMLKGICEVYEETFNIVLNWTKDWNGETQTSQSCQDIYEENLKRADDTVKETELWTRNLLGVSEDLPFATITDYHAHLKGLRITKAVWTATFNDLEAQKEQKRTEMAAEEAKKGALTEKYEEMKKIQEGFVHTEAYEKELKQIEANLVVLQTEKDAIEKRLGGWSWEKLTKDLPTTQSWKSMMWRPSDKFVWLALLDTTAQLAQQEGCSTTNFTTILVDQDRKLPLAPWRDSEGLTEKSAEFFFRIQAYRKNIRVNLDKQLAVQAARAEQKAAEALAAAEKAAAQAPAADASAESKVPATTSEDTQEQQPEVKAGNVTTETTERKIAKRK